MPTSIADHVRSGLLWLPPFLLGILSFVVWEMVTRRIEGGLTEDEIIGSSPNPKLTRIFRASPYLVFLGVGVLVIIGYVLIGDPFFPGVPFALFIAWSAIAAWILSHPRIQQRHPPWQRWLAYLIPLFVLVTGSGGWMDAKIDVQLRDRPTHQMRLADSDEGVIPVAVLRTFERGVLLKRFDPDTLTFVTWRSVLELSQERMPESFDGLLGARFRKSPTPSPDATPTPNDASNH